MNNQTLILAKLEQAKRDVDAAEGELSRLLGEITAAPRAEKTTMSQVVEDAFDKLRAAKTDLEDLEAMIRRDQG